MEPFSLPIPIPMEDEIVHTLARPTCDDPDCPCWSAYYEAQARAEAAYIERGFMSYEQLPEHRASFEPEMTVDEYTRLVGGVLERAVTGAYSGEEQMARIRYRHSLYFGTMEEAERAYELLDELLYETLLEMETLPDVNRREAELRFSTDVQFTERDQATILQLVRLTRAHVFNRQE